MKIEYKKATFHDIDEIIEVQNKGFYQDYKRFGECSGYNPNRKSIMRALTRAIIYLICIDGKVVGDVIVMKRKSGDYFLGGLCIIPEFQNRGIGHQVMKFLEELYQDAMHWSLETPADKESNIYFYQKHGFKITDQYQDGNMKVVLLEKAYVRS